MRDQPFHISTNRLIGYKFLNRICLASTNSFLNFAISFSTAITSVYLQYMYRDRWEKLHGKYFSRYMNLPRNTATSMAWKPSSWQINFAEVVFPIPGVPLNKTAFFKTESFCFFPFFLLPVSENCSCHAFNQLRSWTVCTLHLRKWFKIQVYIRTKYNH